MGKLEKITGYVIFGILWILLLFMEIFNIVPINPPEFLQWLFLLTLAGYVLILSGKNKE